MENMALHVPRHVGISVSCLTQADCRKNKRPAVANITDVKEVVLMRRSNKKASMAASFRTAKRGIFVTYFELDDTHYLSPPKSITREDLIN